MLVPAHSRQRQFSTHERMQLPTRVGLPTVRMRHHDQLISFRDCHRSGEPAGLMRDDTTLNLPRSTLAKHDTQDHPSKTELFFPALA